MSLSQQLAAHLPYLRRYARALTGSQHSGDAFVRSTLEAALADRALLEEAARGRIELYGVFTRIFASANVEVGAELAGAAPAGLHERAAQAHLGRMSPESRQALLLTTLEDMSPAEAGLVLGCSAAQVQALVAEAVAEIERETATRVLIIEDEPLISLQLEDIVTDMGHGVAGTAATRDQARAVFSAERPGLVLADIHLADGSSGIDAVEDILRFGDVPVIFITAYPEKLLTGDRPEPTYLVTKPFHESTVRAAIGQALFFGSSRPLG